ncbi:uncharacterized protein PHACADRAFT_253859 [Phanerochaete carnosa HHB-10118-sp]|uniref:Impact N-terminal domain-containing protein n=1 Tax=Phanerochaete carnosa (strain HHB-10118-sp) TaxID=650164 RepID=K5VYG9_PHACS|nr:uncharacterized protein PHACADRAFT_253859 [Phanerochaete carnosa HHB-10118-sp]EKM56633.1 hypothetical protein PHACADRAFT_253859 [Phanerochaete carnosa HHB-10118-sp]
MATLDSFVRTSKPPPAPLGTSQEVRDRGSIFVANAFRAGSEEEARRAVSYLKRVTHGQKRATHEMYAWRCMVVKQGKTGLGGEDDFEVKQGNEDDGKKLGGARIMKTMQAERVTDAVVVVSQWFGGEMLGPVRFDHIERCAREACRAFKLRNEVEEEVAALRSLDDILATLRSELSALKEQSKEAKTTIKKPDYDALLTASDVNKVKRLVTAREKAIQSVKASIQRTKAQQNQNDPVSAREGAN